MDLRDIETQRQEANNLFRQQRIVEALHAYESSLTWANMFVDPGARNEALEEQLALLTYNISTVYFRKKNFPKALAFARESFAHRQSERAVSRICAACLKMGMVEEFRDAQQGYVGAEVDGLLRRMKIDADVYLRTRMSAERLFEMSRMVSEDMVIPADVVEEILRQGEATLVNCENVVHVETEEEVVVFGDTHGQYFDLVSVLNKVLDGRRVLVFNGDYVDRGTHSVENFLVILGLRILFPGRVHINRGNHELSDLNRAYGLYDEICRKYPFSSESMYQSFQSVFRALPISTVVNGKVFVTHGGLPAEAVSLEDIQVPYRMTDSHSNTPLRELLWSDPGEIEGVAESRRGAGVVFGADVTRAFLDLNGLELLVRSHEAVENGFRTNHGGQVVTIFSAPNYEGMQSLGAYLVVRGTTYSVHEFAGAGKRECLECLRSD